MNFLKKYDGKTITDDGAYVSKEFLEFAKDFKKYIKEICDTYRWELSNFITGHYYVSGFIKDNGNYLYFSYSIPRRSPIHVTGLQCREWVMYRSAKNEKDFTGGMNRYTSLKDLEFSIFHAFRAMERKVV